MEGIYHERQRLQFCLLHSLNNLFQDKDAYKREDLNAIAERLSREDPGHATWTPWSSIFSPHHNVFTGNYDINVLFSALEEKGKWAVWHDKRKEASTIDLEGTEWPLFGIVLNIPVKKFGPIWKGRHWVALRRIEGVWYNLDSDFSSPHTFTDTPDVVCFLDTVMALGGEVFLVLDK